MFDLKDLPPVKAEVTTVADKLKADPRIVKCLEDLKRDEAKTVAETPVKTVEAKKAAAKPVTGDLYDLDDLSRPVTVKSGMTMWSIAKMYQPRYEGARTEEVLVAAVVLSAEGNADAVLAADCALRAKNR